MFSELRHSVGIAILFICTCFANGQQLVRMDSCGVNDHCADAVLVPGVYFDNGFVCIQGCNLNADPDTSNHNCMFETTPSSWFKVETDGLAGMISIYVKSDAFEAPTISMYRTPSGCSQIEPVLLSSITWCEIGLNGEARVIGAEIESDQIYYIVVGALNEDGGQFEMCVSTVSYTSNCRIDGNIEITARSSGRLLTDPLLPGETVRVCFNVNSYTAANNGCQWFQGLIPRFGNGWDPSSFYGGHPQNATINGTVMGVPGNGLYGAATWWWFSDVGYHHLNPFLQLNDFDGNGIIEFCHSLYEADCPDMGGIDGGCCGPCWNYSGTILPPGWFAYGINGSCPILGHPSVDWGDGNICEGTMGPWSFCFDLNVGSSLTCSQPSESRSLELGFITTSDGETGSWTGGALVCRNDKPILRRFEMECVTEIILPPDTLGPQCSENPFIFKINEPGTAFWYWFVDKAGNSVNYTGTGANGTEFEENFYNYSSETGQVVYSFWSLPDSLNRVFSKQVVLLVYPTILHWEPQPVSICKYSLDPLILDPRFLGGFGEFSYNWEPGGDTTQLLVLHYPFKDALYTANVVDENGCQGTTKIRVKLKDNCLIDLGEDSDQTNDQPTEDDPPIGDGNFVIYPIEQRSTEGNHEERINIYPVPSKDRITIEWPFSIIHPSQLSICDTKERLIHEIIVDPAGINKMVVNIEDLIPGVYILILHSHQKVITGRMIKY